MNKQTYVLVANIALAQKMHKRAAVQTAGLDSCDKKLLEESKKSPDGSTPAVATSATCASDAGKFAVKDHPKKEGLSGKNSLNENKDIVARNKTASLTDLLSKSAAAVMSGDGDKKLEAESGKLNLGGSPDSTDVTSAQESAKAGNPTEAGGTQAPKGDANTDGVQKTASENAAGIGAFLRKNRSMMTA